MLVGVKIHTKLVLDNKARVEGYVWHTAINLNSVLEAEDFIEKKIVNKATVFYSNFTGLKRCSHKAYVAAFACDVSRKITINKTAHNGALFIIRRPSRGI